MEYTQEILSSLFRGVDIMSLTIVFLLISFVVMFWRASAQGRFDWLELLKKPNAATISLTKLIQLMGAIVATWIMVKLAFADKITWDILAIYLAYVGSVEGYSKFVSAKYNSLPQQSKTEE